MTRSAHVIARGDGNDGEIALRTRTADDGTTVYELIVNGVFTMDTAETSTERLLAEAVLERRTRPWQVLVGGLGLGYTTARLLEDPLVKQVDVVELEALLVTWLRAGLVPPVKDVLDDDRLTIVVADIGETVRKAQDGGYDAVLLDVDNGPEFLLHPANAALYQRRFLADCRRTLRPDGVLAIWLAAPSPGLRTTMTTVFDDVDVLRRTVEREGRTLDYHVYLATARGHAAGGRPADAPHSTGS